MDRRIAELLMRDFLELGSPLNSATLTTNEIINKEEREHFRKGIGTVMNAIYTELMMPIIRQFPDLDPDRAKP